MFSLTDDSLLIAARFAALHLRHLLTLFLQVAYGAITGVVVRVDNSTRPMGNMQRRSQTNTALNAVRRETITFLSSRQRKPQR
jgi:hypothetical protein